MKTYPAHETKLGDVLARSGIVRMLAESISVPNESFSDSSAITARDTPAAKRCQSITPPCFTRFTGLSERLD